MEVTPLSPEEPDWDNSKPPVVDRVGLNYPPRKNYQLPKLNPLAIRLIMVGTVALPILGTIAFWAITSQPSKKVAPVAQFNPNWAIDQANADYVTSQQQMHLFLWGNEQGELGQWNRLIRAEAQRMAMAVDKYRTDKNHECYRMSRDGCLDTVEKSIEKEWNNAAIQLDHPTMAKALFRYAAVNQVRSGQIDSVDIRPNLFIVAVRKMRGDRQRYLQQTAEAQAGRQIQEEQEAQKEFNREGAKKQ